MGRAQLFAYRGDAPEGLTAAQRKAFEHYAHLRDSKGTERDRRYLKKIWRNFRDLGLADPNFLERFPIESYARIWEMYLAWVFARRNWKLRSTGRPGAGPDMGIVCNDGSTMWVEAVAPTEGEGPDAVPTWKRVTGGALDHAISLRYLNSIHEKRGKWKRWLRSGLVSEKDGFVIAISESQLTWRNTDYRPEPPRIVKALYGLGESTLLVPIGKPGAPVRPGPMQLRLSIQKRNKTKGEVPTNLFVSGEAPEVSAVLLCKRTILDRPRRAGADLTVVHNPFANLAFPRDELRGQEEWGTALVRSPPFKRRKGRWV